MPAGKTLRLTQSAKNHVDSLAAKLKLFFLPPYSPELNRDEFVWNDVKNNGADLPSVHGPHDLHRAVVVERRRYLQKSPKIGRLFFHTPNTCYAAAVSALHSGLLNNCIFVHDFVCSHFKTCQVVKKFKTR